MGSKYDAYLSGDWIPFQCLSVYDLMRKAEAYEDAPKGKRWGIGKDTAHSRELFGHVMEAIGCKSAQDLADLSGVPRATCSRLIENPHDSPLKRVGRVLGGIALAHTKGLSPNDFLYRESDCAATVDSVEHWLDGEREADMAKARSDELLQRGTAARKQIIDAASSLSPEDAIAVASMINALLEAREKVGGIRF